MKKKIEETFPFIKKEDEWAKVEELAKEKEIKILKRGESPFQSLIETFKRLGELTTKIEEEKRELYDPTYKKKKKSKWLVRKLVTIWFPENTTEP